MQTHQAIIFSCADEGVANDIKISVENDLNLYAVDYIQHALGVKVLLDDTEQRNQIFSKFDSCFAEHNAQRVVIFGHTGCSDLGNVSFESIEDEIRERELKLRHTISVVQSKFPDRLVEAYLGASNAVSRIIFKKVI